MKEKIIIWLKAARAPFLVVSFLPCLVGGLAAYVYGSFNLIYFLAATFGIVMAHSAADFIDDYFDFKENRLGNKDQQFHDSPLIHGQITTRQVLIATIICALLALACGIYLFIEIGLPVVYMTLAGLFIVLFYTAPPVKLNFRGLGETALFFAFGPMIVYGVFYILTGAHALEPLLISIPVGVFTMNIGLISNIFDYQDDLKNNKKCIPVILGQAKAHQLLVWLSIIAYVVFITALLMGYVSLWLAVLLLTFPIALQAIQATKKYADLSNYEPAMSKAIALSALSCICLLVGYGLQLFLQ